MAASLKRVRSNWNGAILVCGKCSRKVGGGFGPKHTTPLAKALRKAMGWGRKRKATGGVVEVKCLGICPKDALTLVDARQLGEWLVVPVGADVGELAERLGA